MVLVTSAMGKVGRVMATELAKAGFEVRATDINPKVEELLDCGIKEVMVGDARDEDFVRATMRGCDQVAYVPPMMLYDEDEIGILAIDCALAEGVKQFVQLSVTHPGLSGLLQHKKKLIIEEHLKLVGFQNNWNFTILQPLHYSYNVIVPLILNSGRYENWKPLDRKLGYVDVLDVAEATAVVLREGDKHQFASYELCGPSYLSINEIADLLKKMSGRDFETIWYDRKHMFSGVFENFINSSNDSYSRRGAMAIRDVYNEWGFAANKNVLEWLIGRPAYTMEDHIARELKKMGLPVYNYDGEV